MNTKDCGDENDEFKNEYKVKCITNKPWTVGDEICQKANDTLQCKKDGADCKPEPNPAKRQLRPRRTLHSRDWKGRLHIMLFCTYD